MVEGGYGITTDGNYFSSAYWRYSFEDREMIRQIIEDNIELTKKTQMPII